MHNLDVDVMAVILKVYAYKCVMTSYVDFRGRPSLCYEVTPTCVSLQFTHCVSYFCTVYFIIYCWSVITLVRDGMNISCLSNDSDLMQENFTFSNN